MTLDLLLEQSKCSSLVLNNVIQAEPQISGGKWRARVLQLGQDSLCPRQDCDEKSHTRQLGGGLRR